VRVGLLVVGELAGPALHDETVRVDKPAARARLGFAQPFLARGGDKETGDAGGRFARAHEEDFLLAQLAARDPQCAEQAGERDTCRALDVVIEAADACPVPFERRKALTLPKSSHCRSACG